MSQPLYGSDLHYDLTGSGPTLLFLHDDPSKQSELFRDCAALATSSLRVVVALINPAGSGSGRIIRLMKHLGIGRAVVVAIGRANHTLIDLLEKHPGRVAAASFVADRALTRELHDSTDNPRIQALLRSGRRTSVAKAVASTRRPDSAYGAVRVWATRIVAGCRAGINSCSARLARLELPGLIQLDDGDDEEVAREAL